MPIARKHHVGFGPRPAVPAKQMCAACGGDRVGKAPRCLHCGASAWEKCEEKVPLFVKRILKRIMGRA